MKKSILTSGLVIFLITMALFNSVLAQSDEDIKSKIEKINTEMAKAMMEGDYETD